MSRRTYAYSICLISLVALFLSLPRALGSFFDYRDPLHAKQPAAEVALGSFESYKADMARRKSASEYYIWLQELDPSGSYEAARSERVRSVQHEARRSLFANGAVAILAVVLFVSHLRLARREG